MQPLDITSQRSTEPSSPIFDEDGYLIDYQLWSAQLGQSLADEADLGPLNENHWRVIDHVRERFFRLGGLPNMRRVCRATALSQAEIYGLFGGCLVIWRIAGLPNPGEEAKAYLN